MTEADSLRGWILALLQEFDQLRRKFPIIKTMRPPNLAISALLTRDWGSWDEDKRLLTLSRRLFKAANWDDVVAVFHHELAHQIVSEHFGIRNARPHGEAFSRACHLIEIEPETTFTPRGKSAVPKRIEKLLALGQSANSHEAELALEKAHELALRQNLTYTQGSPRSAAYGFRLVGPARQRLPRYFHAVGNIVSDFYFVQYIANCYYAEHHVFAGKPVRQIELYGTFENLDMAEYVFYFLINKGEELWNQYRQTHTAAGVRKKLSFLDGLYHGFQGKLRERAEDLESRCALVWLGDPGLDAFYKQRNPTMSTSRARARRDHQAMLAGTEQGRRLEIAPGVRDAPRGVIGSLKE